MSLKKGTGKKGSKVQAYQVNMSKPKSTKNAPRGGK
jgi:hypothetical protein